MQEVTEARYRKGKPPLVGWWPASLEGKVFNCYRYWDGEVWSLSLKAICGPEWAERTAKRKSACSERVWWRYWFPGEEGGKLPEGFVG